DRIGRLKIILAGCAIAALTYFFLFGQLTHYVNPALEEFQKKSTVSVMADDCSIHIFPGPWTKYTPCDYAKSYLTTLGVSFQQQPAAAGQDVVVKINDKEFKGWVTDAAAKKDPTLKASSPQVLAALTAAGYPKAADKNNVNYFMVIVILTIMVIYVTM